ncbi:MAG: efflux RND transporter periplasmic adaptor subunit [Deltaproteobacteria bacterium]|nr:efflux RND transporter periplasmic adaptor subunit [Deltaproteobacteria bacterium]
MYWLLALLILGGSGFVTYRYWSASEHNGKRSYVTESVDRGDIVSVVTATGTLNPVTSVQVGTYVSGPIQAIYVDYNSNVTKGQRVAKIDPAPFQVKVRKAEASLANAKAKVDKDQADLALKKLTLERNAQLIKRNLIAQNDVDTARSDYDQARAQLALDAAAVQQAEADLQDASINLGYTDISSPVDGVVVSRNVDVGQTVAASFQTPTLFLIAKDLTKMQVDTSVSESDIGAVQPDQTANFTVDAYPHKAFQGRVKQVRNAPITVQNVVTYDVVIAVDNPELQLKPGMTATVTITTARRDGVVRVPVRALRFNPEHKAGEATPRPSPATGGHAGPKTAVWLLQPDGQIEKVDVHLGLRNDQFAELLSGDIKPGDEVAVALKTGVARPTPPSIPGGGGGPRFGGGRR